MNYRLKWSKQLDGDELDHKNISVPFILEIFEDDRKILEYRSKPAEPVK